MGYEVKVILGLVSLSLGRKDEGDFFMVVGMVDLCKPGSDARIYELSANSPELGKPIHVFDMFEGDTHHTEDLYGKRLRAIDPWVVLDALKHDYAQDNYRRYPIAIALLEAALDKFPGERLGVILYGH